MQFKLIYDLTSKIISTIETSAIVGVKALKAHTFSTTVKNFPKTQSVKGTVTVGNQKRLEAEVKAVDRSIKQLTKTTANIKIPEKVEILNFPEAQKFPEFPKEMKVSNPVGEVRIKNTKDFSEVKVKNQPTKELGDLGKKLDKLEKAVGKLKLDPKISVNAPVVNVPETVIPPFPEFPKQITAKELAEEIFSNDPKKTVPVRLSDGDEFYRALDEMISAVGSSSQFMGTDGRARRAMVDDLGRLVVAQSKNYYLSDSEETGDTNYVGNLSSDGSWYISRYVETGTTTTARYASSSNNELTYSAAWTDKENLTYETSQEAGI